jgi:hypothetical protein
MLNYYLRNLAFRTTTTALGFETTPIGNSQRVRLTADATVGPVTTNTAVPSGKVDFYVGGNFLGEALVHNGEASISKTVHRGLLDEGPLVARYQGDELFNASASPGAEVA